MADNYVMANYSQSELELYSYFNIEKPPAQEKGSKVLWTKTWKLKMRQEKA